MVKSPPYGASGTVNQIFLNKFYHTVHGQYTHIHTHTHTYIYIHIHIIKESPPPHLSVCLQAINSKTTERIFMRFSPIDRVILPENTGKIGRAHV